MYFGNYFFYLYNMKALHNSSRKKLIYKCKNDEYFSTKNYFMNTTSLPIKKLIISSSY